MGKAASSLLPIVSACNPSKISGDCSKYVLNSCHSDCKMSECCECHIETDEIEIVADSSSECSIEVESECCGDCHVSAKS